MAMRQPGNTDDTRDTVASYSSYEEAQLAVDELSDSGFPVSRVSIVGEGIRFVEQVKGPWGYSGAAAQGMLAGAGIGAFVGFMLGAFRLDPAMSGLTTALYGLLFGGITGLLLGPLSHWVWRGRRDFRSIGRLEATTFDVRVDREVADEAKRTLQKTHLISVL